MFTHPSLTFLLGPLFSKKSWLALDIGVCTAAGQGKLAFRRCEELRESEVTKQSPTPVLYIDEVHGLPETSRRLAAIMRYRRFSPDLPFNFTSSNLIAPIDLAAISKGAISYNAGLIVLDQSLGFHFPSSPAPQPRLFSPLVSSLLTLAHSTNAAVLFLLQTRTRSQRSTLATVLTALGAHHVLGLDFFPTDMPKATPYNKLLPRYRSGYLHLRTLASLGGEGLSVQAQITASYHAFSLTPVDHIPNLQTLRLSTFQTVLGPAGYEILSLLHAKGSASTRQLIAGTTASPSRVVDLIKELSKNGYICRTRSGGKGVPTNYALKPAGLSILRGRQ